MFQKVTDNYLNAYEKCNTSNVFKMFKGSIQLITLKYINIDFLTSIINVYKAENHTITHSRLIEGINTVPENKFTHHDFLK